MQRLEKLPSLGGKMVKIKGIGAKCNGCTQYTTHVLPTASGMKKL